MALFMKQLLLNLLALLLLPHGLAAQAAAPKPDANAKPVFELTELQKAQLDAARQELFRWQDKMQQALDKFSALCTQAQKENHWPAVQCNPTDLAVRPMPAPVSAAPTAIPAAKK
jgi:hypothetical protein